jgi:hypothetical protein
MKSFYKILAVFFSTTHGNAHGWTGRRLHRLLTAPDLAADVPVALRVCGNVFAQRKKSGADFFALDSGQKRDRRAGRL